MAETADLDVIVIGAGVLGAAVARALSMSGRDVTLVERSDHIAGGMTSRNSGVVHAGLYDPPGSLKTRLCRRGRVMLQRFATEHGVAYERVGKFVVANSDDESRYLHWLKANADPVPLHWVDRLPRHVQARRALFSPETGIVDPVALTRALIADGDVAVLVGQAVQAIAIDGERAVVFANGESVSANLVVNCGGLSATDLVANTRHWFAKGSYFAVLHPNLKAMSSLVYPAVSKGSRSLGVHLTVNTAGEWYLGPDLEWVEQPDYGVDRRDAARFVAAARSFLPWLETSHLTPGYAGIRAKLDAHRQSDFRFLSQGEHHQVIHCLGIESPGLTAAMAIADAICHEPASLYAPSR